MKIAACWVYRLLMAMAPLVAQTDPASAQSRPAPSQTAQAFAAAVSAGNLGAAEARFSSGPQSAETIAALGAIQFLGAVEKLGQGLYRHGLRSHRAARNLPFLRLPVPENSNPAPLTYEAMRAIYAQFLADITRAEATLAKLPAGEVKLPVDILRIIFNFAPAGQSPQMVPLSAILQRLRMMPPASSGQAPALEAAFDRADMIWLRGYAKILSALTEFILAHDWRNTYEATAHLFFAGARDPSGQFEASVMFFGQESGAIADGIALIHLMRWPVSEPKRLLHTRDHLKAAIALSRENWKAILAETDDDREWLPGPTQKNSALPGMAVTQAQVAGWHEALEGFEAALDGRRLVPHWRFNKGVDLAAYFTQPRTFDLVLWFTGHAALPYLKDGPTYARDDWMRWQRIFGGRFLNFAFWFN